mgnify:CR=1 FL=1
MLIAPDEKETKSMYMYFFLQFPIQNIFLKCMESLPIAFFEASNE